MLGTVQLKGNLILEHAWQQAQHLRVIFAAPITSLQLPLEVFLFQAKPACNVYMFLKTPTLTVHYQAYYT